MASEIRVNSLTNRSGLSTVSITDTGAVVAGLVTATTFSGPLTGAVTGNVTGDLTGNVTGNVTGNITGNVTGTATTATALSGSPSITVTDITATGNVSIGGTLTYEDVTNIDAVGIITAQSDVLVGRNLSVTSGISTVKSLDYAAIDSTISDTAVDVFIYDTSKDSDGGAWRKRTTHTSWYNETLNTADRGSRREFPAVAVLVLSANKLTIYDGDDPDLPMWMEAYQFVNGGNGGNTTNWHGGSGTFSSVAASNGIIICGATGGCRNLHFVNDRMSLFYTPASGNYTQPGGISNRNDQYSAWSATDSYYAQLVAAATNDVAMTVLPSAPIDDATGLPVPTIAVGTDGGGSIIKDDGTVVDITITTGTNYDVEHIDFTDDNRVVILWNAGGGEITIDEIPGADTSANYPINLPGSYYNDHSPESYSPGFLTEGPSLSNRIPAAIQNFRAVGTTAALSVFEENKESEEEGMVAFISSSYNTGYQQGKIKGTFLSDTDTTNITGSELITNTDFSSDLSGWTNGNPSQFTRVTTNVGGDTDGKLMYYAVDNNLRTFTQYVTCVAGEKYVLSLRACSDTASAMVIDIDGTNVITIDDNNNAAFITKQHTFTAGSTSVRIRIESAAANRSYFTDFSVRLAVEDRSLNNKGLQVFGTINKSAVATGAELVAYSGFSGSNYLRQPYNSSLSAGTGSQTFMGWVYANTDSTLRYVFGIGEQDSNEQFRLGFSNSVVYFDYGSGSAYSQWNSTDAIPENKWTFVVATITAGQRPLIYIDGKLLTNTPAVNNAAPSTFLNATSYIMTIGINSSLNGNNAWNGSLSLIRYSHSIPSLEQIKKIYEDEKMLFQENAKATLYGSSDAVTALAYDDDTDLLHVGTSSGRSDFQGLCRINNTTTAVTTAITAQNEFIIEQ